MAPGKASETDTVHGTHRAADADKALHALMHEAGKHLTHPGVQKDSQPHTGKKASADVRPDAMSAAERAQHKISHYLDVKRGVNIDYDKLGRITKIQSQSGQTKEIAYADSTSKAISFSIRNQQGKPVRTSPGDLSVDQTTGEIVVLSKCSAKNSEQDSIAHHYAADGALSIVHTDSHGRRLAKEICQVTDDGIKPRYSYQYQRLDTDGKPSVRADLIDDSKPVLCTVTGLAGKVQHKYQFANSADAEKQKVLAQETITYSSDAARQTHTETHTYYAKPGKGAETPCMRVEKTLSDVTGITTITTAQANGVTQHAQLDRAGNAVSLTRREGNNQFTFQIQNGKIAGCTENGKTVPQQNAILVGELTLQSLRTQYGGKALEVESYEKENLGPSAPRAGIAPSGSLVLRENGLLKQMQVSAGSVKDAGGKLIGTATDDGTVSLTGPPPKAFKIGDAEGSAFHGVGSDGKRLDLAPSKDSNALTGIMKSPDGSKTLRVVASILFDAEGKFYAHLNNNGQLEFENNKLPVTDLNSQLNGWAFSGVENGKARQFTASNECSHGRMFIPDAISGKPTEYSVKMGMLIDKSTGEQFGTITPPKETAAGNLEGGSITLASGGGPVPLANYKLSVFDLKVEGESIQGRNLQGVCLGQQERLADGSNKQGVGGLLDLQEAIATQQAARDKSDAKTTDQQNQNIFMRGFDWLAGADKADAKRHESENACADMENKALSQILQTGAVSEGQMNHCKAVLADTKTELAGDPLIAQKLQLDQTTPALESLPKDTSTINGTVKMGFNSADGKSHPDEFKIQNGNIVSKTSGKFVGTIDAADGRMTILNPATGAPAQIQMRDIAGAVWHLEYPSANGQPQKCDWISLGHNSGIASMADLKRRADAEVNYASAVNDESHSDASKSALGQSNLNRQHFDGHLDAIVKNGISTNDLELLTAGPRKFVRAGEYQTPEADSAAAKKIAIPDLSTDAKIAQVNGKLRLGSESYEIKSGKLFHIGQDSAGKDVIESSPAGALGPNYAIAMNGQPAQALSAQSRVLMEFTTGSDSQVHRLIGMGRDVVTGGLGYHQGGLVDVNELTRQAAEATDAAAKGDKKYFNDRPYLTGFIGNLASGDQEALLAQFKTRIESNNNLLKHQTDELFKNGFTNTKCSNAKLDGSIALTNLVLTDIGSEAESSQDLAVQASQLQHTTSDAVVMAAITVATMGAGSYFAGAVAAGDMTLLTAGGAEIAAGTLSGATISVVGRASNSSNWVDNAKAGALEGGSMAAGSAIARGLGSIAQIKEAEEAAALSKAGQALSVEQSLLLKTAVGKLAVAGYSANAIKGIVYGASAANSVMQTTAFMAADGVRDKDWSHFNASNIALGSLWMMVGSGASDLAGVAGQKVGLAQDSIAVSAIKNTSMAYTTGSLGAMGQAWDNERMRIARELNLKPELVTNSMMRDRVNYSNILNTMNEGGYMAALSAPLLTAASRPKKLFAYERTDREKAPVPGDAQEQVLSRPVPEPRADVSVKNKDAVTVEYRVGRQKFELYRTASVWYESKSSGDVNSPVKVHVTTDGAKDIRLLQQVLIPALNNDPILKQHVSVFKTFHPETGLNPNYGGDFKPGSKGNNAKGFTIYTATPEDAIIVQKRLDEILADSGLGIDKPMDTGNVDRFPGRSNRAGIVRDTFVMTNTADGALGAKLEKPLADRIQSEFQVADGRRLSAEQLRKVETEAGIEQESLGYDKDGELMLITPDRGRYGSTPYHSGVYLDESRANKNFGHMTDRPAFYALAEKYNLDPVDLAVGQKK